MLSRHLSEEEVNEIWQAINRLQLQLDQLPNLNQGQVLSALLGIWVAQHFGNEHREGLLKWTVDGATSMAKMVDAGIIKPQVLGTQGNA